MQGDGCENMEALRSEKSNIEKSQKKESFEKKCKRWQGNIMAGAAVVLTLAIAVDEVIHYCRPALEAIAEYVRKIFVG